jgi:hypothetical protein
MAKREYDERWFEGLTGRELLAEKLCQVLNREADKDDPNQKLQAAILLVVTLVVDTSCRSCRQVMVESIGKVLPRLLQRALGAPLTGPKHTH